MQCLIYKRQHYTKTIKIWHRQHQLKVHVWKPQNAYSMFLSTLGSYFLLDSLCIKHYERTFKFYKFCGLLPEREAEPQVGNIKLTFFHITSSEKVGVLRGFLCFPSPKVHISSLEINADQRNNEQNTSTLKINCMDKWILWVKISQNVLMGTVSAVWDPNM